MRAIVRLIAPDGHNKRGPNTSIASAIINQ